MRICPRCNYISEKDSVERCPECSKKLAWIDKETYLYNLKTGNKRLYQPKNDSCIEDYVVNGMDSILNLMEKRKFLFLIVLICVIIFCIVFKIAIIPERNSLKFKTEYEESVGTILSENSIELLSVEYTKLVPDYDFDYWAAERVNEYEVMVYVRGIAGGYEEMYLMMEEIKKENDYLLSNTYEKLPLYSYVSDDTRERGFHEVQTTLIFEDNTTYKVDYLSLLKNDEAVWQKKDSTNYSYGLFDGECHYPDCGSPAPDGYSFCYIHKCEYSGCNNSVDPLKDCCSNHSCAKPGCSNQPYAAENSEYCKIHYRETIQ